MKRNEGKYPIVSKLPKGAILVKEYAAEKNIKEHTVYTRLKRGTNDFHIVIYYERNFVVPA